LPFGRAGRVAACPRGCWRRIRRELATKIHRRRSDAVQLWRLLHAAGLPRGARPFGVEARACCGSRKHFIVARIRTGLTDPFEASASWAVHMQKPFSSDSAACDLEGARSPSDIGGHRIAGSGPVAEECHLVIDTAPSPDASRAWAPRAPEIKRSASRCLFAGAGAIGRRDRHRGDGGEILSAHRATPFTIRRTPGRGRWSRHECPPRKCARVREEGCCERFGLKGPRAS